MSSREPFTEKAPLSLLLILALGLFLLLPSSSEAALYRVKPGGTGDGSSWERALGEAAFIAKLDESPGGDEFWLVAGTYRPFLPETVVASDDPVEPVIPPRERAFALKNGVALYGGFAGTETTRQERNWAENVTVLSGALDASAGDNSYHVVLVSDDRGSAATLDGFTVTGGQADGTEALGCGGGLYVFKGSPAVTNCTFLENGAAESGGGLYVSEGRPVVTSCDFRQNEALQGGGLFSDESQPTLKNTTFSANSADSGGALYSLKGAPVMTASLFSDNRAQSGGALFCEGGAPVVTDCSFSANVAEAVEVVSKDEEGTGTESTGGALFNVDSSPVITGCTFAANRADLGGAIYNRESSPIVTNVTFSANVADQGGAIYNRQSSPIVTNGTFSGNSGALYTVDGSPVVANSILWNRGTEIVARGGTTTVTYSVVRGGLEGEGNIEEDPGLLPLGDNGGPTETFALDEGSPAIDAGLAVGQNVSGAVVVPAKDQRGVARPKGAGVDMGAFEYADPDEPDVPVGGGGGGGGCQITGSPGALLLLLPLALLRRQGH